MFCFWTGEMNLGGIEGVVKTQAGFLRGREITRVWYDDRLISYEDLVRKAAAFECADVVFINSADERERLKTIKELQLSVQLFDEKKYRKAGTSDQKKQIQGTVFMDLGLTPFQLTKINAFARKNSGKALTFLSPKQADKFNLSTKK
jgi:ABC-type phosphate transport system auxiliary subunit